MNQRVQPTAEPESLSYEADLCGTIEQALKGLQGYGFMALELIQNADDARANVLTFDARPDGLHVHNDANFTTCGLTQRKCPWAQEGDPDGLKRPCNFHAIINVSGRTKIGVSEQIGRFGIGFVSVYQITDTPIVRSSGVQLLLNPLTGKPERETIDHSAGTEFELPWASSRSEIRDALNASRTPAHVEKKVIDATSEVLRESLLFLRHLRRVEVSKNGRLKSWADIERTESRVDLTFGPEDQTEQWMLLSRDASDLIEQKGLLTEYENLVDLDRSRIVSVAIPVDGESLDGLLFAYLPTEKSTSLPLHVNGDFFPHSTRRDIVLSGEGAERYWNETLLEAAAATIGENFGLLREALGHKRLWEIGGGAFQVRKSPAFSCFWREFSEAAKSTESVWTIEGQWRAAGDVYLAPKQLNRKEQAALASIGIDLLHPSLRPHLPELSSVGVSELKLSRIAESLKSLEEQGVAGEDPNLKLLWSAISKMIELSREQSEFDADIEMLKESKFLTNQDQQLVSPESVWRLPDNVDAAQVRRYVRDCPIAHIDVMQYVHLAEILDKYGFKEFANNLNEDIKDSSAAEERIGMAPDDARGLYTLLTCFATDEIDSGVAAILSDTPILRTSSGFVSPSRGQLPGGFNDPIGHLEIVDTTLFPKGMDQIARDIFEMKVLSFHEYIDDHLEEILALSPTQDQYRALMAEIVGHRHELDDEGSLEVLAGKEFVRTRDGTFARPGECYYWSSELEELLGDDGSRWVDDSWMPAQRTGSRLRDVLENQLGMPTAVPARHVVDRITKLAGQSTPSDVAKAITPIIKHVINNWVHFGDEDLESLEELQNLEFLPALVTGERDEENLYLPEEVYRANRAQGFWSQVPVVDLAPLRQSSFTVNEFLDLLKIPSEPPTSDVVAHLQHCIDNGVAVSDLTYAILNERVENESEDDLVVIDELNGTPCIFDNNLEVYLPADHIFWQTPPIGGYWHAASSRMRLREPLFRRLGVEDGPKAANYAGLMAEIAQKPIKNDQDLAIHERCLGWLAEALERGEREVQTAIEELRRDETLISVDGESILPECAVWVDSEQLAGHFGDALDQTIIRPPNVQRTIAARLFQALGVDPLSKLARRRLAAKPDNQAAHEATELLRERSDLLLWLAPNPESWTELKKILADVEIRMTESLRIQAEIEFEPPVRSPTTPAPAYYDREQSILHVKGTAVSLREWAAAFRALFFEIEQYCPSTDVKPLGTTASMVMQALSREEAEEALRENEYRPPEDASEIPIGAELGNRDDDNVEEAEEEPDREDRSGEADDEQRERDDEDMTGQDEDQREGMGVDDSNEDEGANDRTEFSDPSKSTNDDKYGTPGSEDYKSKAKDNRFGSDPQNRNREGESDTQPNRKGDGDASGLDARGGRRRETPSQRQARRARMLTYVNKKGARGKDDSEDSRSNQEVSNLIDVAAIKASLRHEEKRGWTPEEQPHGNPGYDIISISPEGKRRLIEVKGLEGAWTPRGIKLSPVQYKMAEDYPEEFWIYVVEHARDLELQHVSAIKNPFNAVEEYWFDHNWREIAEETATAHELNVRIGAKLKHQVWGTGKIIKVEQRGYQTFVTVDFGEEGRKYVPYSRDLKLVD